ncbi:Hypothetical predicted protein [Mytilus galloprovincialis]|uniref:Fibronectin type-III domain-containing protein n=1 Tax=Mytilus galloprovincialis TaxID=29158 RepID=A0A8B6EF12_MYTGA|nr:Hypothetical predicted protein [Mytilus galloprovincialis]
MTLSKEEENYVRLSLLLTGISPRAVRILFDGTFQPSSLEKTIKQNYNKLSELKQRKQINSPQWSLMFPAVQGQTGTPDSTTFDVTLMITLLRNCSKLTAPRNGYDDMPGPNEMTPAADLARIKYYRNYLAHASENKITANFFKTAWDEISSAVLRLGNQQLKDECDELRYKVLDQSNTDILKEIEASKEEIKNLQFEFDTFQEQMTNNMENWHFKIPRNVKIQFASETSLKVEWEPPEHTDHLQSYKVYWKKTTPDAAENCKDVPKEENCTTLDGLTEMTNYWIRISAYSLHMQASSPQQSFRTTKGTNSAGIHLLSNVGSVVLGGGSIHFNIGGLPPQEIQGNINLSSHTLSMNQQNQLPLNQFNTRMPICPSDNIATSSGESQRKRIKMDD